MYLKLEQTHWKPGFRELKCCIYWEEKKKIPTKQIAKV